MSWRSGLLLAAAILGAAVFVLVLLVLTGIIAEPETVIESVVRALSGR
jgi:hypothetical protein